MNTPTFEASMLWKTCVILSFLLINGCGGCEDDGANTGNQNPNNLSDTGAADVASDQGMAGDASSDSTSDDASTDAAVCLNALCGGVCCGNGQECYEGFCLDPCPNTRCGATFDLCCGGNEVCLGQSCLVPGALCAATEDCPLDEICEPTIGRCVPRNAVEVCEFIPPVADFEPRVDCRWTPNAGDADPNRVDVVATPVVANLTDDNMDGKTNTDDVPDLVFLSYDLNGDGCCAANATIRVVHGECNTDGTMTTLASINLRNHDNSAGLALADLDNDGVPEIIAPTRTKGVIAYKRIANDGSLWDVYWENTVYPTTQHTRGGAIVGVADLDANGEPEIIIGNVVLNGQTGVLKWDGLTVAGNPVGVGVGNNGFLGPSSSVADINLDGKLEVAAGNTLYDFEGRALWTFDYGAMSNSSCGGNIPCDGFNAIANFDNDPEGEVVIVRLGEVFILNHDGALLWRQSIPIDNCSRNESGPPTIADFDGDGRAEIGTAAADYYTVLDMDCDADPLPAGCFSRGVLWAVPNQDCSSRVTASSVFDFEGDGKAEMIYADETSFRIFDGTTGAILYQDDTHGSHTRIEMPIVVDVDNDGNSEIIIPENRSNGGTPGVEVWADTSDNWVRTRRIWNQHGYHVTNINEDGSVPINQQPNWSNPRLNNYRQNVQPAGLFDAPNLMIESVEARGVGCGDSLEVIVRVTVANSGALGVPAGVPVNVVANSGGDSTTIHSTTTTTRLLPGQREIIEFTWTVPASYVQAGYTLDASIDPDMTINECKEDDNTGQKSGTDIVFSSPDLIVKSVVLDTQTCGRTQLIKIAVTVRNDGTQPVPANVPVALSANIGGAVGVVRTTGILLPGEEETLTYDWTASQAVLGKNVTITATVDPEKEVYACDNQNQGQATALCQIIM
jgi:hypothetical protein